MLYFYEQYGIIVNHRSISNFAKINDMKKLILSALILISALSGFAQVKVTDPPVHAPKTENTKKIQNPAAYACPKCYAITKGAGKCATCNVDKVQLGTYYCPMCQKSTGAKAGKCPTCGMKTTQMTRKYAASHSGAKMKA